MRVNAPTKATWIGLTLCVAIVAAWFATLRWTVALTPGCRVTLGLAYGSVFVAYPGGESPGVSIEPGTSPSWLPTTVKFARADFLFVPLWMLLVPAAAFTIWFWRRNRKPPPGHCQHCGYNLTGNTSGTCSECGRLI